MHTDSSPSVGFIGLGAMGEPMAMNLIRALGHLTVWNRSASKCIALSKMGGKIASAPSSVFAESEIVFVMLANGQAMDEVLGRGTVLFRRNVQGRVIVNTATVSPRYSKALEADIHEAGGVYVEAPVSGSREPAKHGQLIAMLAGNEEAVGRVEALVASMCHTSVRCGAVPGALAMKFAVNIFLIASVTGLVEAANFAQAENLDMHVWAKVIKASQMSSDIARLKVDKLLADDLDAEAAIGNVFETTRLITEAARNDRIRTPLMDVSHALYQQASSIGLDAADMIAVIQAFKSAEAR